MTEKIIFSALALWIIGLAWYGISFYLNCDGQMVRGVFLWECVK